MLDFEKVGKCDVWYNSFVLKLLGFWKFSGYII